MDSRALGAVTLEWLTSNRSAVLDSSATLRFTPLSYRDLDDVSAGLRFLTVTFDVENLGANALERITVRAVAPLDGVAGSALSDVRGAPSAAQPAGQAITDARVAATTRPVHATILLAQPTSDPSNSDFQGYSAAESAALEIKARAGGTLGAGERVLDYGFVLRNEAGSWQRLAPGARGRVSVAFRLPRSFAPLPKPYRFNLRFLVTSDDRTRITRAIGESTEVALTRASEVIGAKGDVQLVLFGGDDDAPKAERIAPLRMSAPRIALEPPVLLEGTP